MAPMDAVAFAMRWPPCLLSLLLAGCEGGSAGLPVVRFELDADGPYLQPWPGDQHRDDDGTISMRGFARPAGVPLIDLYVDAAERLGGWGTTSPIHLLLDGEPDRAALPTPAESIEDGSALILVDVDPDSPWRGERFPVVWRLGEGPTAYQPEGLLTVAPLPGFPLRGDTTYALLLTREAFAPNEAFQEVFEPEHPHAALWEPVGAVLEQLGLQERDIVGGTVFTTQDPIGEMARIARYIRVRIPAARLDQRLKRVEQYPTYTVYRGVYRGPIFTHGERPFFAEGGGFQFDEQGWPILAGWENMRLSVCVPEGPAPPEGYPVVIYQHGTGGDYLTPCDSARNLEPGRWLGEVGFVVLGIDQPLHGPRAGGQGTSEIANFNILNPESARSNFRQGAADALYLAHSLAEGPVVFTIAEGEEVVLDTERVVFLGHSQGGLTGALAAPFWAGDVRATMLSGAGGLLSITIVDRKDPLDLAALVASVAGFATGEQVHELHPAVGLVQMLVEPTDPINYAPYWFRDPTGLAPHEPVPVLATSGTDDAFTPYRSTIAMAAAAALPPIPPRATPMEALDIRGVEATPSPAQGNASAYDGPITAGFSQWEGGSHFVIFEDVRAAEMVRTFLLTAVEGEAVVDRPEGR